MTDCAEICCRKFPTFCLGTCCKYWTYDRRLFFWTDFWWLSIIGFTSLTLSPSIISCSHVRTLPSHASLDISGLRTIIKDPVTLKLLTMIILSIVRTWYHTVVSLVIGEPAHSAIRTFLSTTVDDFQPTTGNDVICVIMFRVISTIAGPSGTSNEPTYQIWAKSDSPRLSYFRG